MDFYLHKEGIEKKSQRFRAITHLDEMEGSARNEKSLISIYNNMTIEQQRLVKFFVGQAVLETQNEFYSEWKKGLGVGIKRVIFSPPATIILWKDNTKTIVRAGLDDFDPEKGMAMAIAKKALGNKGNYYNVFKKWIPEDPRAFKTVLPDDNVSLVERMTKDVSNYWNKYVAEALKKGMGIK